MAERPILMSAPMVRAILADRKTQTRRVVKPQPCEEWSPTVGPYHPTKIDRHGDEYPGAEVFGAADEREGRISPYGQPGDRLWVRENGWQPKESTLRELREGADTWPKYAYDADGIDAYNAEQYKEWGWKRRPSIHMPRWACRIVLEVQDVHVERLFDISEADARAEGMLRVGDRWSTDEGQPVSISARRAYEDLWHSINGSWSDVWVWVVAFRRAEAIKAAA